MVSILYTTYAFRNIGKDAGLLAITLHALSVGPVWIGRATKHVYYGISIIAASCENCSTRAGSNSRTVNVFAGIVTS